MIWTALCLATLLAVPAVAAEPFGWRGDGSGRFPKATPPTELSTPIWSTPLPAWSNASPAVAGGRIYLCAEPNLVVALDEATGRVLWQREVSVLDGLEQDAAARAKLEIESAEDATRKAAALRAELARLKREARRRSGPATDATRLAAVSRELSDLELTIAAGRQHLAAETHEIIGHTSSTPVTDGASVWVVFRTGVVARFAADGTRRWSRFVGRPSSQMRGFASGHAASPLLVGRRLVVGLGSLYALDAETGRELWKGPEFADFGTPAVTRVAGQDLLVTAFGELVRVADGRIVGRSDPGLLYVGPTVRGDEVFFFGSGSDPELIRDRHAKALAYRLVKTGPDAFELRHRWTSTAIGGIPVGRFYASPVLDGDRLYGVTELGHLYVLDAKTGRLLHGAPLDPLEASYYASPIVAGGRLYVVTQGRAFVHDAAPPFGRLGRVELHDEIRASPVAVGRRLYIRSEQSLTAFEAK